ncbi:MAG TPA: pitrilysin family protein [Thermoanaerobaculia bacterium]|nr:pitrilysin family protein [Thermoanaerobaculia bacterium]
MRSRPAAGAPAALPSLLLALLLTATLPTAAAAPAPAGAVPEVPEVPFEHYTLPNGLDVILHVDRRLPVVHLNQWFHVGSKNERPGRSGFAHLFEHLMFQGSVHAPGEYFSRAERAGANLREGGVNGTTNTDRTNYFATVPSGNLEYLLWLDSDRLATLPDALTQEILDNQIEVVRNERRQSLETPPYGRWQKLAVENLYPAGHPYSWTVFGSHEDLAAATLDDVREFFTRYYTPNNMTLVLAGDFDPAEARRLIERYYGPIAPGPALERPSRWVPRLDGERVIEVADRVPQERVYMLWPAPPLLTAEEAALDLAATVLADGLSSRLERELVYERQLATDVTAVNMGQELASAFLVVATARPGAPLADIEAAITRAIAGLAADGPTADELARAQAKWEHAFVGGLERIGGFGGKADRLATYHTYLGRPGYFRDDMERYLGVGRDDVRRATARWLDTPNRLVMRFRPETAGRPASPPVDRAAVPALGGDRSFRAPAVRTAKLDNGLEVLVVERPELPKVTVGLVTRAGALAEPAGREGLAHLTALTLRLGTAEHDSLQLDDALARLGTSVTTAAGRQTALAFLDVLSRHLAEAVDLLAEVVRRPTFPAAEVERERQRHLATLAQQENIPMLVASNTALELVFGKDHPYGRPLHGTPATVAAITRDEMARFHRERYRPASSALVFVGDVTLEEATRLAGRALGDWRGGAAPVVEVPAPRPTGFGRIHLVDRPGAPQTFVVQALPGPHRMAEGYYDFALLDAVWGGGGFSTRLNLNLREDKGYSYGVSSSNVAYPDSGLWWAKGGVQTDRTAEAVAEMRRELADLAGERPVGAAELATAVDTRTRGYAQQFESYARILQQVSSLWIQGLPASELQREYDATAAAAPAGVAAAARQWAQPERSLFVLVGDREKVAPRLEALGLGPVVVHEPEGGRADAP